MKFLIAWLYSFIFFKREREVFGGRENENPKTLKRLRVFFFFFLNGNGWVEFGYIVFGLNGPQWNFS